MDLNRVAVFVRVAEALSFTAAADSLGLPKSSVSRSIARLEEELGVRLLQRTTRKLSLTDAGKQYFEQARRALTAIEEASSAAADMGKDPRGTVRLTAPVDLGVSTLADIVARFCRKHPQIRVELHLTARVVDLVEEGIDIAVRAGRLEDSSLIARRIGVPDLALYASTEYLKRKGRPRVLADLEAHDCVLFRARDLRSPWQLTGPNGNETVRVSGPIDADDMLFVRSVVLAGAGVGILPHYLAETFVRSGEMARVLPDYTIRGHALHVVTPSRQHEPARVTLLREFLVENLANCTTVTTEPG